jgi:hypothetical protein
MSEVVPNSRQEFWLRPTVAATTASPAQTGAGSKSCVLCGTEFMAGSRFCYICGAGRESGTAAKPATWLKQGGFFQLLGIQQIRESLGLPIPSLVGFLAGVVCLIGAMRPVALLGVQNLADFQGIQLLRVEWLLGAVAAFLAGILVKDAGRHQ